MLQVYRSAKFGKLSKSIEKEIGTVNTAVAGHLSGLHATNKFMLANNWCVCVNDTTTRRKKEGGGDRDESYLSPTTFTHTIHLLVL